MLFVSFVYRTTATVVVVIPAIIMSVLDFFILRDGLTRLGCCDLIGYFLDRFARIARCSCLWAHTTWISQTY